MSGQGPELGSSELVQSDRPNLDSNPSAPNDFSTSFTKGRAMDLSGDERGRIRRALCRTFPSSTEEFRLVVEDAGLGKKFTDFPGEYENRVQTIIEYAEGQSRLTNLLRSARDHAPDSPSLKEITEFLGLYDAWISNASSEASYGRPVDRFEAVLFKSRGFENVRQWLSDLDRASRAVCRVEPQPRNRGLHGYGTGFLIAPNVVLTNDHVASGVDGRSGFWRDSGRAGDVVIRFDCEYDAVGQATTGKEYRLASEYRVLNSGVGELDFALLRVDGMPSEDEINGKRRGFLRLHAHEPEVQETLVILQHPQAEPIKLALGPVAAKTKWAENRVAYFVNTDHGSSGSPCLNQDLAVAALHHAGPQGFNQGVPSVALLAHWRKPENAELLRSAGLQNLLEDSQGARGPDFQAVPPAKENSSQADLPAAKGQDQELVHRRIGRYVALGMAVLLVIALSLGGLAVWKRYSPAPEVFDQKLLYDLGYKAVIDSDRSELVTFLRAHNDPADRVFRGIRVTLACRNREEKIARGYIESYLRGSRRTLPIELQFDDADQVENLHGLGMCDGFGFSVAPESDESEQKDKAAAGIEVVVDGYLSPTYYTDRIVLAGVVTRVEDGGGAAR